MTQEKASTDWNAVKPALYEAARGHWFELDSLFNERDQLLSEVAQLRKAVDMALAELTDLHQFINNVNIKGLVLDYRYEDRQRVMNTVRALLGKER